jgi:hypothetical protein
MPMFPRQIPIKPREEIVRAGSRFGQLGGIGSERENNAVTKRAPHTAAPKEQEASKRRTTATQKRRRERRKRKRKGLGRDER